MSRLVIERRVEHVAEGGALMNGAPVGFIVRVVAESETHEWFNESGDVNMCDTTARTAPGDGTVSFATSTAGTSRSSRSREVARPLRPLRHRPGDRRGRPAVRRSRLRLGPFRAACGTLLDRDLNAAKNILAAGLAVSACGGDVSHSGSSRVRSPAKQETTGAIQ